MRVSPKTKTAIARMKLYGGYDSAGEVISKMLLYLARGAKLDVNAEFDEEQIRCLLKELKK